MVSDHKTTWTISRFMQGVAFTLLVGMGAAQADNNRCPTPSSEKLKAIVLAEKQLKLGVESNHYSSNYSLDHAADGTLEAVFTEEGVLDGDYFVVVVDPCRVELLRSFHRSNLLTGTRARNP